MARTQLDHDAWRRYLSAFHDRNPGVTEEILATTTSNGLNPYQWLLELIPRDANLLDLACGSAPLLTAGWSGRWVGLDRSPAELELGRAHSGRSYVSGEANDLPFGDGAFSAIACSMALMLLTPLDDCLAEVSRVLAPGGSLAVLLPGAGMPLTARDLWRWGRLLAALRVTRLTYPNDRAIRVLGTSAQQHGLSVISDERMRFAFLITSVDVGHRFVDSLYLPLVPANRAVVARRLAGTWAGTDIGVPLRRVLLRARS